MATLYVRNVPEDLYNEIQRLAKAGRRSVRSQVVIMLAHALEKERNRQEQTKVLVSIRRRRFKAPKAAPLSLNLLHEDRKS